MAHAPKKLKIKQEESRARSCLEFFQFFPLPIFKLNLSEGLLTNFLREEAADETSETETKGNL